MIAELVQILFFQCLGELISKIVLPYSPGPVIGLAQFMVVNPYNLCPG